MTAETTPSFDDLSPVADALEDDAELIKLSPDEMRQIRADHGDYASTPLYLARGLGDLVQLWNHHQIEFHLAGTDIGESDVVSIVKTEDTATYSEGGNQEYSIFEVGAA